MQLCFQEDISKERSVRSCQEGDIREELSEKDFSEELSGNRYQRSCQEGDISEELSGKRYQGGAVRKELSVRSVEL